MTNILSNDKSHMPIDHANSESVWGRKCWGQGLEVTFYRFSETIFRSLWLQFYRFYNKNWWAFVHCEVKNGKKNLFYKVWITQCSHFLAMYKTEQELLFLFSIQQLSACTVWNNVWNSIWSHLSSRVTWQWALHLADIRQYAAIWGPKSDQGQTACIDSCFIDEIIKLVNLNYFLFNQHLTEHLFGPNSTFY
mgnify:CR=1 FL=1